MMYLSSSLSFCTFGEHIVLLDLSRDRYFLLPATMVDHIWNPLISRQPTAAIVDRLEKAGLSEMISGQAVTGIEVAVPERSLLEENDMRRRRGMSTVPTVAWCLGAAYTVLKRDRLANVLRRVETRRTESAGHPDSCLLDLALSFEYAKRTLPIKSVCLPDSLALLHFLARRGYTEPRLVIGVKLHPFAAHCWVQTEEMILNENVDYARTFSPIRVV